MIRSVRLILFVGTIVAITSLQSVEVPAQTTKSITMTPMKRAREFNPSFVGKPEQKIEELEHQLSDSFAKYDAETMSRLLSDDLIVMGIDSIGVKKFIIAMVGESKKFENEYRVLQVEKTGLRIVFVENIAIVSGQLHIDTSKGAGGGGTSIQSFQNIWLKDKTGTWKCISMAGNGQKLIHYPGY